MEFCKLKEFKNQLKDNIIIGATGHIDIEKALNINPKKEDLSEYDENLLDNMYKKLDELLNGLKNITFISGMARGWDEIIALFAIKNNYNLILAIPNSVKWHKNRIYKKRVQAIFYDRILEYKKAKIYEINKIYNDKFYYYSYFARNQFIVDNSDIILTFYGYKSGGTLDCIKRAKKLNKCIFNFYEIIRRKDEK
ncbi:hypothetical protein FE773_07470 [Caminibacter mediatlanticus TB-2]|uniref:Smf/DprA SLOG domain-containing protein n=1 Tax=Caminibacter mediatlanticus TB-2 TaxID=391592 RepID=A0ABX5VD50_9BACT|nr:DNA-processing protein DprA [Caminibacter mediatlanticus]QCT95034.1 hypothetical protein FE773_07470 [Caminibacter mediatlanticus TB-2]